MISPGMPATKNVTRQPYAVASGTTTIGASTAPSRPPAEAWTKPMLKPRRCSLDANPISDWLIGSTGPSARPITARATSSSMKLLARPEPMEHTENTTTATMRIGLRRFRFSAQVASA